MSSSYNIDAMLEAVQASFRSVRSLILTNAGTSKYTLKPDGSPVTAIDVEVEQTITAALAGQFPGVPVYGEESGYSEYLPELCWLLDPIDGTEGYIANKPVYTCMAVCIEREVAVAAVIYNPSTDEMFVARKGKGAFKDDNRLDLHELPLATVADCKERFIKPLDALLRPAGVHCVEAPVGVGYAFTRLVQGESAARITIRGGGYVHDYAPGGLFIQEAGGSIIPIMDEVYSYATKSFVACHPELAPLINEHRAAIRDLEVRASS